MNIAVIGTGYVGLVTGVCFAEKGNRVWCIDIDASRIDSLKNNIIPIYEPGLEELVKKNVSEGRLHFSTDAGSGLEGADICFIAVGTPSGDDGCADISQVLSVADEIAASPDCPRFVVIKSTVPVGSNRSLSDRINASVRAHRPDFAVDVISNPEFLKEGVAIEDCMHPDRVVAGTSSEAARDVMRQLYRSFVDEAKIIFMNPESAEITKYAANSMLATRISFMNEMARLCDAVGADIFSVKKGMATDPRIGPYFLNAGCGYGGSCFPKDVQALQHIGRDHGLDMKIVTAVESVNYEQKELLPSLIRKRFGDDLSGLKIAVLGLAFKPQTDDMREAPSITSIETLLSHGAEVRAYDPVAHTTASAVLSKKVEYASSVEEALLGADAAILVTEWPEFAGRDWGELGKSMRRKIVFDGRNFLDRVEMLAVGFEYFGIGRNAKGK